MRTANIDELVKLFSEISIAQSKEIDRENPDRFNRLYSHMDQVARELSRRGNHARRQLMSLYHHPNFHVRLNAANRTLGVAPLEARAELEAIIASRHMPQAADAKSALRALDSGEFQPM